MLVARSRSQEWPQLTAADDLDEILAWREERSATQNLTLHYDRMMLILEPTPLRVHYVSRKHPAGTATARLLSPNINRFEPSRPICQTSLSVIGGMRAWHASTTRWCS
jgi:hypothetical protein